ncbi:class I SAM-dependent RNA methyltransferase [Gardnerella vaginalis]|uniref:class I SAM-dependent RNA methyltransferase n=1 Tax=Gardnerella vaginalis TaxID=2702 RepID=UPI000C79E71A|nr:TRAM domain-containing protein [Gardnerella vaginalis]NSX29876.1 class I SAM-dependent RNA methyltransferase [Gardnerella vaginalis]PKZ47639.1 RNA methyltransferase [Gardnerella vaginalis]
MQVTMRIERYADQGRCVGHLDGRVVFVRFALPGELVVVRMDEPMRAKAHFFTGEVVEVLEPSADRVEPQWKLAGPLAQGGGVGGADLIHVSLPGQIRWKASVIANQFQRLAHMDVSASDITVECMPGDEELNGFNWRTRMELVADDEGRLSMRKRESHDRIAIDTMPLASRAVLAVADSLDLWNRSFSPNAQIRLAVPEPRVDGFDFNDKAALLSAIGENYALIVNDELVAGSALLSERVRVAVDGDSSRMRTFDYDVDARGFWQIHRAAPEHLVNYVLGLVRSALGGRTKNTVLWDLYSGSGLFTIPLATLANVGGDSSSAVGDLGTTGTFGSAEPARVLSIEGAPIAVKNARRNIGRAGLSRDIVEALEGDVAQTLESQVFKASKSSKIVRRFAHPDVVVLDPPRAGAKAQVCKQIAKSGARAVVYVACDPTSLARDVGTFRELGYSVQSLRAFDLYPETHHVETVVLMSKAD